MTALNNDNNRRLARQLAGIGIPVFPARITFNENAGKWDKAPLIAGWQENAATDPAQVDALWSQHPEAVPGIELGRAGLVVLDTDRHPGGADGVAAFDALSKGLPPHPTVRTAGNGVHHIFRQPEGEPLGNRSGALPDGIDVRGNGGWIVAPGSIRSDGARYEIMPGLKLSEGFRNGTIPLLPPSLVEMVRARKQRANSHQSQSPAPSSRQWSRREEAYAAKALDNLAVELANTPKGTRNTTANAAIFTMATMVARDWIEKTRVVDALWGACQANGLIADDGENAVQATLASGIEAGLKNPHPDLEDRPPPNDSRINGSGGERAKSSGGAGRAADDGGSLYLKSAADVVPENISFLWQGRLARGKHTCIAGEGGLGKSQLLYFMAAMVSTGGDWPCGEGIAPVGNVIILSAEDGLADMLVPRLMAAGADLNKIHIVQAVTTNEGGERKFDLRTDMDKLERAIKQIGDVALVIIDPVSSYMGDTDSHNNTKLRAVLDPITGLAEATGVAVATCTHFNKGTGGKAIARVMGSAAFVNSPRAAFAVMEDPDDKERRLFLPLKNNLGPKPQGLAFRREDRDIEKDSAGVTIIAPRIYWEINPVTQSADEVMGAQSDPTAKDDAIDFLRLVLANGANLSVDELQAEATMAGLLKEGQLISQSKPFRAAREALGIEPKKDGFGPGKPWRWTLPGEL